jgi:hypothetical protein
MCADVGAVTDALTLRQEEYVRIMDKETGQVTVAQGPTSVFIAPNQTIMNNGMFCFVFVFLLLSLLLLLLSLFWNLEAAIQQTVFFSQAK